MTGRPDLCFSAAFLGLPWEDLGRSRAGVDCWGLITVALRETDGVDAESCAQAYAGVDDEAAISALFGKLRDWPWREIPLGTERPKDVVGFRRGAFDILHVGLVVEPGRMLHVSRRTGESCLENYTARNGFGRLVGAFRHEAFDGV